MTHNLLRAAKCALAAAVFGTVALGCEAEDTSAETAPSGDGMGTTGQERRTSAEELRAQPRTERAEGRRETGERAGDLRPADVLGISTIANRGEVESARFAVENGRSEEVKGLARMIRQDHQQALDREMQMGQQLGVQPATDSRPARNLEQQNRQLMERLRAARGDAFDATYVSSQIDMHRQTLQLIDDQLVPAAQGEMAQHLRQLRTTVEMHLRELQRIESQLAQRRAE